jgi:paraquat-inducible protein B
MAKRFSPAAIGAFVVASFALLILAVVVVGAGSLFRKPHRFVCMFHGNLNGLRVGAPVKVRGVQIGTVAEIKLMLSASEGRLRPDVTDLRLPVLIEIDRTQLTQRGGSGQALGGAGFDDMTRRGMRAQLKMESLLTGLLYIDLDLHPGAPLDLALVQGSGPYREIPTVPTDLEAMQGKVTIALDRLASIDFPALAASITGAADSLKEVTSSPALKATLETLKDTTANLNRAVISIRQAVQRADVRLDPLLVSLRKNSEELNATLEQTRIAMAGLQATLDPDSPLLAHLDSALQQMTDTTRSVGELTDYLQRNPSSLVRGRYVRDRVRSQQ